MRVYRFGNYYLNKTERRVTENGKYLELTPKTFDVLQLLVEKGGDIVTKEEILGIVWGGSFVDEGNLPVHIMRLRRALGETKANRFIETVPGSGYRFVSPVQSVSAEQWERLLASADQFRGIKTTDHSNFDSIAVLPFQNEGNDAEIDYLTEGITGSLISSLSRIPGLKVLARNSVIRYAATDIDVREVGQTLGVSAVLTGRVREIKERLSISVELTNIADRAHLWGAQYHREFTDIFQIQEEITSEVSEKLRSEIATLRGGYSQKETFTHNAESYRFYLKGKYFFQKRTSSSVQKAIEYFQRAVSTDQANVAAYAEMLQCYCFLYLVYQMDYEECLSKIRPIMDIMSKLDQDTDVVQVTHGEVTLIFDWDFKSAERHLRRALSLNPNSLLAHSWYSSFLLVMGRYSEALQELAEIQRIDPFSVSTHIRITRLFFVMERYEDAINSIQEALELEPANHEALMVQGKVLTEIGDYDTALRLFQQSLDIEFNYETAWMMGYAYALKGQRDDAVQIIQKIEAYSDNLFNIARIHLALGDKQRAYSLLDLAFERHEFDLIELKCQPIWASIRNEPRFKELIDRVGL